VVPEIPELTPNESANDNQATTPNMFEPTTKSITTSSEHLTQSNITPSTASASMKIIREGGISYKLALFAAIRRRDRSISIHMTLAISFSGRLAKAIALPPQPQNASITTAPLFLSDDEQK